VFLFPYLKCTLLLYPSARNHPTLLDFYLNTPRLSIIVELALSRSNLHAWKFFFYSTPLTKVFFLVVLPAPFSFSLESSLVVLSVQLSTVTLLNILLLCPPGSGFYPNSFNFAPVPEQDPPFLTLFSRPLLHTENSSPCHPRSPPLSFFFSVPQFPSRREADGFFVDFSNNKTAIGLPEPLPQLSETRRNSGHSVTNPLFRQ